MSELKFVFVVFCFTAVAVSTVFLRNARDRMFYKLIRINAQQQQLERRLWRKQLRMESLISPPAQKERFDN